MLVYNVFANISLTAIENKISLLRAASEAEQEMKVQIGYQNIENCMKLINSFAFLEKLAEKIGCSEFDLLNSDKIKKRAFKILENIGRTEFETEGDYNSFHKIEISYDGGVFLISLIKNWDSKQEKYYYEMDIAWPSIVLINGLVTHLPNNNYLTNQINIWTETEGKLQQFIDEIIAYSDYKDLYIQKQSMNSFLLIDDLKKIISLTQKGLTRWEYNKLSICDKTMLSVTFKQAIYYLDYSPKKNLLMYLYIERKGFPRVSSIEGTPV